MQKYAKLRGKTPMVLLQGLRKLQLQLRCTKPIALRMNKSGVTVNDLMQYQENIKNLEIGDELYYL